MDTPDPQPSPRMLRDALRAIFVAHGAMETARRPCGAALSMPHAHALLTLSAGPLSVSALTERMGIDQSNVSRLCARMEALGELERAVDPSDRRARRLVLTQRGQRVAAVIDASSAAHFDAVLSNLSTPQVTLDALAELARALTRRTP